MAAISAVFLDRDGVINQNRGDHVKSWEEFSFLPGAREGIARFSSAGVRVFVVSNQAVINRGIISRDQVEEINDRMVEEVERYGGKIDGLAFCPHTAEEGCACRKPRPGLLLELARRHGVDLAQAFVIGDALTDIQAGQSAGCATLLVLSGRGKEQLSLANRTGTNGFLVAQDLWSATGLLLADGLAVA